MEDARGNSDAALALSERGARIAARMGYLLWQQRFARDCALLHERRGDLKAALEALSCEVPVIATAVGGLPEVVRDGVDGFLLPVGDVEAMAARALELLRDDERRLSFGQAGRRRVAEQFEQDKIVQQYRRIYRRVLDE